MPNSETQAGHVLPGVEVLTLPEVAAYLRVSEEAVLALVARDAIPAQKVGGEWRFLKRAVVEWLRFGPSLFHEFRMFPPAWLLDLPFWEDLVEAVARRSLNNGPKPPLSPAKRGSKEAVLRHFGVFENDADVEEELARIRARREASGE